MWKRYGYIWNHSNYIHTLSTLVISSLIFMIDVRPNCFLYCIFPSECYYIYEITCAPIVLQEKEEEEEVPQTKTKTKTKRQYLGNLDASAVVNSMYPFSSTSKLWDIPKSTQFRSWIMTQPLMQLFRSQLLLKNTYIHTYTLLGLRYHRLVMNQSRSTVRLTDQGCLQYLLMDPIRITSLWECRDSNMACRRKAWSW